ncbi:MAG: Rieske 2Fe-2S domain-containing protein [Bacteroidales bacterium]|nr:Rieske 2Fe-2S domain-containing protein [Bacteroidales bacterium]
MKRLLILFIIPLLTINCSKDSDIIPNVRFIATVDIVPQYSGKSLFIIMPDGRNQIVGVNGVVVWNNGGDTYYAFDRTCTHSHDNGELHFVEIIEDGNPIVRCPECESEYLVATEYGDIVKGPAVHALKAYPTSYSNGQLTIRN